MQLVGLVAILENSYSVITLYLFLYNKINKHLKIFLPIVLAMMASFWYVLIHGTRAIATSMCIYFPVISRNWMYFLLVITWIARCTFKPIYLYRCVLQLSNLDAHSLRFQDILAYRFLEHISKTRFYWARISIPEYVVLNHPYKEEISSSLCNIKNHY